jgi:hypothetical protein
MISQGTWRYSKEYEEVTTSRVGLIEGSKSVCTLANFSKSKEEIEANGKAISAVPEMIDALKKADAYFNEFKHLSKEHMKVWDSIARALEKAEGKQALQKKV